MLPFIFRVLLAAGLGLSSIAQAQSPMPQIAARSWLLLDITTNQIVASSEADLRIDPASLTKLMTAYLVFAAIKEKRLAMDLRPPVSQAAYKAIGSRMFLDPAKPATVDELLRGMIVQSGNDASIVLAEAVAGSEPAFVALMNKEAQRMGLKNTQYANSTGLPAPLHGTTARDLSMLSTYLIRDFPEFYPLYSQKEFAYNNIKQPNRNRLLFIDPSVDGLKTGHTDAAGWCLIASAQRDQPGSEIKRRLLSVVTGAGSDAARTIESQKLLNWGYQNTEAVRLFVSGKAVGKYEVWKGKTPDIEAGFERDVLVSVGKTQISQLKADIERTTPLLAPIAKGQKIGVLKVKLGDQIVAQQPILALAAVEEAGFVGRLWDTMRLWIGK